MGGIDTDPGDRGTGGTNVIQGRIFLPSGRRLDRRAQVKLRSSTGGAEQYQLSDDTGAFSFRRLTGGSYTLNIDAGKDFEIVVETIDIVAPARRRSDPGMVVPVNIILKAKSNLSPGKVGTIDSSAGRAPDAALDLYKHAIESAKSGDRKKAIEQLNEAIAIYPNFMTALNELGVQYMALKEWQKAANALRNALKIAPEAFHPRLNYGITLLQMKDYSAAAIELQKAMAKDATSASVCLYLGRARLSLNDLDGAERDLKQAISIGGEEGVEAYRYLGAVYIEKRQGDRAAEALETYLKLAPKAKDADRIRGIIREQRGAPPAKP
jgi:tetratricopeptide (TPR) repeat protein